MFFSVPNQALVCFVSTNEVEILIVHYENNSDLHKLEKRHWMSSKK